MDYTILLNHDSKPLRLITMKEFAANTEELTKAGYSRPVSIVQRSTGAAWPLTKLMLSSYVQNTALLIEIGGLIHCYRISGSGFKSMCGGRKNVLVYAGTLSEECVDKFQELPELQAPYHNTRSMLTGCAGIFHLSVYDPDEARLEVLVKLIRSGIEYLRALLPKVRHDFERDGGVVTEEDGYANGYTMEDEWSEDDFREFVTMGWDLPMTSLSYASTYARPPSKAGWPGKLALFTVHFKADLNLIERSFENRSEEDTFGHNVTRTRECRAVYTTDESIYTCDYTVQEDINLGLGSVLCQVDSYRNKVQYDDIVQILSDMVQMTAESGSCSMSSNMGDAYYMTPVIMNFLRSTNEGQALLRSYGLSSMYPKDIAVNLGEGGHVTDSVIFYREAA